MYNFYIITENMKRILLISIIFIILTVLISCENIDSPPSDSKEPDKSGEDSILSEISVESGDDISETSEPDGSSEEAESDISEKTGESSAETSVSSGTSSEESIDDSYYIDNFKINGIEESLAKKYTGELYKIIENSNIDYSICYYDINTGCYLYYNPDQKYRAASVIKAPYVLYLLSKKEIDLDEKLTLRESQIKDGSGVIKNYEPGTEFTIKKLIYYSITDSDNTAYKMLYDRFGFDGFNDYTKKIGLSFNVSIYDYLGKMTAEEAVRVFKMIYDFIENDKNGEFLYECFNSVTYNNLLSKGIKNNKFFHKYGFTSASPKVLHDAGIVLAGDDPYIISVFSNYEGSGDTGLSNFKYIAETLEKLHLEIFK